MNVFLCGQTPTYSTRYCMRGPDFCGLHLPSSRNVESLTRSGMGTLLVMVVASTVLFGQSGGPDTPQKNASVADARQIVSPSVVATERSWQARDHYTYVERA